MTENKQSIALVTIPIMFASLVAAATIATMILAPLNVKASSSDDGGDDDERRALSMDKVFEKDGEVKHEKSIKANEHSGNADNERTIIQKHSLDKDDNSEAPALTLNKVEKMVTSDGEIVKEDSKSSSEKSSSSAAKNSRFIRIEDETFNRQG